MPPFAHDSVTPALQAGALYQQSLAGVRRLVLRLVSRQRLATLHTTRLALIKALNPDLVNANTPAYLTYAGVSKTLRLPVVYDGGLEEGDSTTLELRLLAHDPVWSTSSETTQALAVQASIDPAHYLLERAAAGGWSAFPSPGGAVNAILVASDGTRYIGGAFTGNVLRWDESGNQWVTLTGLNGTVYCLAEGADGSLYAGGAFTTPGSYVARWNGTAWAAVGTPPALLPYAIALASDGTLYIGGSDQGAGETTAEWNGTTWFSMAGGPGGTVHSLLVQPNGILLAGGSFTGGVQRWNGAVWSTLGSGITKTSATPTVRALARAPDGTLYAGGDFDKADGANASYAARWNGVSWQPLGHGLGAEVYALAVREADGALFVAGDFILAGGLVMTDSLAQWNGYAWFSLDISIERSPDGPLLALAAPADDTLLVGYGAQATASSAAITTVTNSGSAAAYPVLTMQGAGRVYQLVNWSTGEAIAFDLVLLDGETITLDLRPHRKTITSSFRGNLLRTVVPGSSLATWRLLPGENRVALLVDDPNASATLAWYERHWSLDGADEGGSL